MPRNLATRIPAGLSSRITALLGPTNTGKTHRAVERMLELDSGIFGFPLRLLAREVYDKICQRIGAADVALITGEEKRVPQTARYFVCTVEAMPLDLEVDFLGVDEIQLATDPQRGHTFTDRLLYRRGRLETWFLGSSTVEDLFKELVPTANILRHPRLSELRSAGETGLNQLKPRSAVVGFTATHVYELAERLKRRKGGAAVVFGALSPRARQAQVSLYQSGDVDYLVATDAIGMGLNLAISHVALAATKKFDGRAHRPLSLAELGQITGRAGRHLENGSFGTLKPLSPLSSETIYSLEKHHFPKEKFLWWRSPELDFSSLNRLVQSLKEPSPSPRLKRTDQAEDQRSLEHLAQAAEIQRFAAGASQVELLWKVAQIPDYRKILFEQHIALLRTIFEHLITHHGKLEDDWLHAQVERLADTRGDIDALLNRMAFVRTFTYITHQSEWLSQAEYWQARTREIEDSLSDALHEALVARFIERHRGYSFPHEGDTALLDPRPTRSNSSPQKEIPLDAQGAGHPFASLLAFKARLQTEQRPALTPLSFAAAILQASDDTLELNERGSLSHNGKSFAQLIRGRSIILPDIQLEQSVDFSGQSSLVQQRALAYTRRLINGYFGALDAAGRGELGAPARGLVYQLFEQLGTVERSRAAQQLSLLSPADGARLESLGVVFGQRFLYVKQLFTQRALGHRRAFATTVGKLPGFAPAARVLPVTSQVSSRTYLLLGWARVGRFVIRVDILERSLTLLKQLEAGSASEANANRLVRFPLELSGWLGIPKQELPELLRALGYRGLQRSPKVLRGAPTPKPRGRAQGMGE